MSLINDALKKAQRQRTGDHRPTSQPPMPGGSPLPARPARSDGGLSPQILLLGAGALLGVLIATGAVFFLRSGKPEAPATTPQVVQTSAPKSAEPAPGSSAAGTTEKTSSERAASLGPQSVSATSVPPAPIADVKTDSAPPPTAAANISAPTVGPVVATRTSAEATKPATAEPSTPSLRMIEAIEALRVAGIRVGTGNDAKVLMNDRVFRLGDTVDHALGIKLTGVTANALTFRDASGATYTRNF